jgi:acetyl esterase/lipase
MRPSRFIPLALSILFLLAPGAAAKAPLGDAFYTPPKSIPGKAHGDIIWYRPLDSSSNFFSRSASSTMLVLYRSTGIDGKTVAVSGAISFPKGKAPKGGFPTLTFAHGTTGIADQCAPTKFPLHDDKYSKDLRKQMDLYLKAGYAVANTDYEGLGTPGGHPYLVGVSEGRSVLDIVRAARKINPRVGKRFAIMGHSQGGHAALWAAALARKFTPELQLKGTVAYAPASHIKDQAGLLDALKDPTPLSALVATIFRGNEIADPSLKILSILTDKVSGLYPSVDERCLSDLAKPDSWGGIAPSEIVREGTDRAPLLAAVDRNDPENLTIRTPLFIGQGTADGTVIPIFTDQLNNELSQKGTKVTYKKYEGVDHGGIPEAAKVAARAYLKKKVGR